MSRLQGKRALITGGTTGIGLETARQFMAEGARVSPGPIATPLYDKLGLGAEQREGAVSRIRAGRFGEASEIARAVVFQAFDETGFAVGSELIVDGDPRL